MELVYSDLVLIKQSNGCSPCCDFKHTQTQKTILNNVSGVFKEGLNAIIGPSGCGKTSLLNILARSEQTFNQGSVGILARSVNDVGNYNKFPVIGYLTQADTYSQSLTIEENIWFYANLKLPSNVSAAEKHEKLRAIFWVFNLNYDSFTQLKTKLKWCDVSEGDKKLIAIALELLCNPQILLLDEPTSGLDAASSLFIMQALKNYSAGEKIIVATIHQPGSAIYEMLDGITILTNGNCCFQGPANLALDYFDKLGFVCKENPANFFIDLINELKFESTEEATHSENTASSSQENIQSISHLIARYQTSNFHEAFDRIARNPNVQWRNSIRDANQCKTGFLTQFKWLTIRILKRNFAHPRSFISNTFVNIFISLIFGFVYFQMGNDLQTGIRNRFGVLFFACSKILFGSIRSLLLFATENLSFQHEHASKYYKAIPYFTSKLFFDLFLLRAIDLAVFGSILYWLTGLQTSARKFFIFIGTIILTAFTATSVGVFLAQMFSMIEVASVVMTLVIVNALLFSRLLVDLDTVSIGWFQYISIAKYSFTALCLNEFDGLVFSKCFYGNSSGEIEELFAFKYLNDSKQSYRDGGVCFDVSGEVILERELGINFYDTPVEDWQFWENYVALSAACVILILLSCLKFQRNAVTHLQDT